METGKTLMVPRARGAGVEINRAQRTFNETILYDTIMLGTCHYTFVKTNRISKTKTELWVQAMGYLWVLDNMSL